MGSRLSAHTLRLTMVLIILVGTPTANWEPSVAANAEGDPREAVQAMLDGRALALQQNNLAGWMKTIDPRASAAFRNHQEASFRGLRSVPLVDYQLRLRTDDSGDLAAGSKLMEKKSADGVYLPETRQMYRLGTYDDRPVVDTMWWTYVLRDGRWYVSADDDLRSIGLDTARQLWDFGPVLTRQTEHFLVITKPQDSVRGQSLALVAEEAMAQFQSRWNRPWSARIPLIVPSSAEEAAMLLRSPIDVANFTAFVTYTPLREPEWSTTAPRIYAQETNLASRSRGGQIADIVHELTHAALSGRGGPFSPVWLHEGLAEYVRLNRPAAVPVTRGKPDRLPDTAAFSSADVATLRKAYDASTSAVSYLARLKGPDAPFALFDAIGQQRNVAGSPSYNVDAAFKQVLGMSLKDFEKAWSASR